MNIPNGLLDLVNCIGVGDLKEIVLGRVKPKPCGLITVQGMKKASFHTVNDTNQLIDQPILLFSTACGSVGSGYFIDHISVNHVPLVEVAATPPSLQHCNDVGENKDGSARGGNDERLR